MYTYYQNGKLQRKHQTIQLTNKKRSYSACCRHMLHAPKNTMPCPTNLARVSSSISHAPNHPWHQKHVRNVYTMYIFFITAIIFPKRIATCSPRSYHKFCRYFKVACLSAASKNSCQRRARRTLSNKTDKSQQK